MELSKFIEKIRTKSGLKQSELANLAGVPEEFIRDLENGKESLKIDEVNKVLKFYGHVMRLVPIGKDKTKQNNSVFDSEISRSALKNLKSYSKILKNQAKPKIDSKGKVHDDPDVSIGNFGGITDTYLYKTREVEKKNKTRK